MMQFQSEVHAVRLAHRENSLISRMDTGCCIQFIFLRILSIILPISSLVELTGSKIRYQDSKTKENQVTSIAQISIFYSAQFFEHFLPFYKLNIALLAPSRGMSNY